MNPDATISDANFYLTTRAYYDRCSSVVDVKIYLRLGTVPDEKRALLFAMLYI